MHRQSSSNALPDVSPAELRVAVLPVPGFTMLAFAGFLDALRLAADEGDRSRPIRCRWTVLGDRRMPIRASNGVSVTPDGALEELGTVDYVVVVGGVLREEVREPDALMDCLRAADRRGMALVGLCTGSLTLARAGLMRGRRSCVSWFHHDDFVAEFPNHDVVSDRLFLDEGDRITCAGGTSVIHLASALIDRHCGPGTSDKGLRIMLEDAEHPGDTPQPVAAAFPLPPDADWRVRRAVLLMERRLADPLPMTTIAATVGVTGRQLARLFNRDLGLSPAAALTRIRLISAERLLRRRDLPLSHIAAECGFFDGAHLSRRFRTQYGLAPSSYRAGLMAPDRNAFITDWKA